VLVSLGYEGEQIRLAVTDDGTGIRTTSVEGDDQQGHGIANMQARAQLMGGDLVLESAPKGGTRVVVTVPCDAEEEVDG
jgi:signal transduction histidine kinase